MTVQAVFFDMGGTIETFGWTPEFRIKAIPGLRGHLAEAGILFDLNDRQLYELISSGLQAYHQLRLRTLEELSPQRVWNEFILANRSIDPPLTAEDAEKLMVYFETHFYERAMRPEMPEVLEALQKMGLKIGLISNVNSQGLVPLNLERYGIRHFFDPVVLSSEYGRRKPDPAIFHYAAWLASLPTSQCVYVGDRIARDIVGARRAGFKLAVQIRHNFEHGEQDEGATPDAVIDRMTELLDILEVESNRSHVAPPEKNAHPDSVRAILFDAGDILYFRPRRGQKLTAFLKELGLRKDDNLHAAEKFSLTNQAFQDQISLDQYREALLRMYGVTATELIERGKQIMREEDNDLHFFEGIRETLLALRDRGYLLGIITDTANALHLKLSWFEKGGFGDVWDSVISSKELGVRKPDPRIYQAALRQLGIPANQAVFVGHKVSELDGAKAVGMITTAFNYEENAKADFYIEKFTDLLKVPILIGAREEVL